MFHCLWRQLICRQFSPRSCFSLSLSVVNEYISACLLVIKILTSIQYNLSEIIRQGPEKTAELEIFLLIIVCTVIKRRWSTQKCRLQSKLTTSCVESLCEVGRLSHLRRSYRHPNFARPFSRAKQVLGKRKVDRGLVRELAGRGTLGTRDRTQSPFKHF